ncbi:transcriptional regulator, IclR family [Modicisalibacter muralis]|uniref:Transcriptional regulator, IclR family n=1 Tax=Modicisalibacter muralis TaxID=119000 RepID=A0A1G9H427_9GAMM|nr:IclR family transcriptional regulator [Halomonas muralis]SDL07629.1 transcriptional regulator, IclR family [Halomonas muralis]
MSEPNKQDSKSSLYNQSIEKGFTVLGLFNASRSELSLSEISRLAGWNMGSAQRITYTLEKLGYLYKNPVNRKYRIAIHSLSLGYSYLESNLLIDCANPLLSELSNHCEESVSLTEPCGLEMVYVARFPSRRYIPIHMPIGSRVPMYCTAAGRAYLSVLPLEELERYFECSDLKAHTPRTLTDSAALVSLIEDFKRTGLSYNDEEYYLGDINIGAPVLNSQGRAVAAIHVTAPSSRWTLDDAMAKLGPPLIECARAVTKAARTLA